MSERIAAWLLDNVTGRRHDFECFALGSADGEVAIRGAAECLIGGKGPPPTEVEKDSRPIVSVGVICRDAEGVEWFVESIAMRAAGSPADATLVRHIASRFVGSITMPVSALESGLRGWTVLG